MGIKNEDLCVFNIGKALKRRLAGISACGDEDADLALFSALFERGCQQMREHLKRHILECAGRAMPKLEHCGIIIEKMHGCRAVTVEIIAVCTSYHCLELGLCKFIKEGLHYFQGSSLVVFLSQSFYIFKCELRQAFGDIQSAVGRKAVRNRLRSSHFFI